MIIAPRVCQGGRRPPGPAAPPHLSRRGRGLPAPHPRNCSPLRGERGGEGRAATRGTTSHPWGRGVWPWVWGESDGFGFLRGWSVFLEDRGVVLVGRVKCLSALGRALPANPTPEAPRPGSPPLQRVNSRRRRGLSRILTRLRLFLRVPGRSPAFTHPQSPLSPLALPPGSNSFLPLSQTEANGMRGQDFWDPSMPPREISMEPVHQLPELSAALFFGLH